MNLEMIDNIQTLQLNLIATVALSIILLVFGQQLKDRIGFLQKFCIPAPVIGGFLFAFLALALKQGNVVNFSMDTTLQSPLMVMFFTTVGLGGSFALLKKGGKALIIYWILCVILSISQNGIGVALAKVLNIQPMFGIMAGAASMLGGHGGAAAFGNTAVENMGVEGALTVAMAAATFGLVSGSLMGGPIARFLIEKKNLKPTQEQYGSFEETAGLKKNLEVNYADSIKHLTIILIIMTLGGIVGNFLSTQISGLTGEDIVLPAYVGAMMVAVIFRNLNDRFKFFDFNFHVVDLIGDISLGIFLSMALMTIKLWELSGLAGPLLIIVFIQVLWVGIYGAFIVFRAVGGDYDAAIMVSGLCGHALGATPNAVANMDSVTRKYGPSSKAFMIVPIVGAFLVDIVHLPQIIWFMNVFGK